MRGRGVPGQRILLGALTALGLGSCVGPRQGAPVVATPPTPLVTPAPAAANAFAAGVFAAAMPPLDNAEAALASFRASCPALLRRTDTSGLTQPGDWASACAAAASASDAGRFFADQFAAVRVGDGRAFVTGYYEPEIRGSRSRAPGYETPIYRVPSDLIEADLGAFNTSLAGRRVRGRVEGQRLVPYHDRTAIDGGALAGRGLELAWAADPIELFFLQVQGSGRLRLPDGSVMRIGYAGQNGRDYVAIGRVLRQAGALQPGQATMQGIVAHLRAQPDGGRSIMQRNPSYVFFRELEGEGAIGALGVPVRARATVATDPAFVPLGAPVWLRAEPGAPAPLDGLWIAQDTGGAIRGANRFDSFWGAGEEAARIAGAMSARGEALVLLPKISVTRLTAPG